MKNLAFLRGPSPMAARIQTIDWSTSSLGAPEVWPAPLRTVVHLMLNNGHPMYIMWGEDLACLYNDAFCANLGASDDLSTLGQPARSVWGEVWSEIGPQISSVLAGEGAVWRENALIPQTRDGQMRDTYWTYSFSPIDDEAAPNGVGGVLSVCTETTQTVLVGQRATNEGRRLALLFEQTPSFMTVLRGPTHIFEFCNPSYIQLVGHRDVVGKTVAEALPEVAEQGFVALLDGVYQRAEPYLSKGTPILLQQTPGAPLEQRFLDFVYQPIKEEDGQVTGIFVEGVDVTERTLAAALMMQADERLRNLNTELEQQVSERTLQLGKTWQVSPDLLGVLNADGFFEKSNPAWQTILGWTPQQVSATKFFDFIHPDDLPKTYAAWDDAGEGIPALRFENRYRTIDGDYRWLSWVAVPSEGKVYCSARDITEDKERAAALADTTIERDRLWRNSEDLFVVIDIKGNFLSISPAVTKTLGWLAEEMVGKNVFDFIVEDDIGVTSQALATATSGALKPTENRYRHKDGSLRWISWVAAPEGDLIFATGRHITAEKEAATEMAALQDALRQSQKMEAVGQLTGGIAHDFNNMLAVVMGSLDLLERRLSSEDVRARHYVQSAAEAAKRAANLTQRLLAFSRQQPLQPEVINLNRLVSNMSDLMTHSLGTGVELETVLAAGLWDVNIDPNQLENVLLNLGVNSRDAMPGGGKLTIETQNAHLDARYVSMTMGLPAGQYVMIAVTDTGSGMAPDVVAKAFDPFFTTKVVGKGTGLGLSQVYGFVKQSGGHVKIYSEPGEGTSIKIYLPRTDASGGAVEEAATETGRLGGEGCEVVLVVDDEAIVRQFSVDAMTELGFQVLEAANAAGALRLIDLHPEICLLFTDIVMPETNGRQLVDEVMRRRPDMKVLYTTGYTRNAVVHNGVVDQGVDLIGKPFKLDELAAKIREILDRPKA